MKPKRILLFLSVALVAVIAAYFLFFRKKSGDNSLLATVQKSAFEVQVMTTGELRSRTETKIMAPQGLRQLDIYQVKIANLIPEGSIVKQGDFVASLDNSDVMTKLNQQKLELDKQEAQYTQAKLDTMLHLRAHPVTHVRVGGHPGCTDSENIQRQHFNGWCRNYLICNCKTQPQDCGAPASQA